MGGSETCFRYARECVNAGAVGVLGGTQTMLVSWGVYLLSFLASRNLTLEKWVIDKEMVPTGLAALLGSDDDFISAIIIHEWHSEVFPFHCRVDFI